MINNLIERKMATPSTWSPSSWRDKPIKQQPNYEDAEELKDVLGQIKAYLSSILSYKSTFNYSLLIS